MNLFKPVTATAPTLAKAASLHLEGNRREALLEIDRLIEAGGGGPEAYSAKGHIQLELEQYAEAAQSYSNAQGMNPLDSAVNFNLGVCFYKLSNWPEARTQFEKSLEGNPGSLDSQIGKAVSLLQLDSAEDAVNIFDRVLKDAPGHTTALFGKAVGLQLLAHYDQAAEIYKSMLEGDPQSAGLLGNLVCLGMAKQDHAMTQHYAERLMVIQPNSPTAMEGLATCAFAEDDCEAAVRLCGRLVNAGSDTYERWFNLAVAHHKLGQFADAAKAYLSSLRLRPDDPRTLINLAHVQNSMGDIRAARATYEQAAQLHPDDPDALFHYATLLDQEGAAEDLELLYRRLLNQDSQLDAVWFRLGFLRLKRSDYRAAVEAFEACLKIRTDWPEARLNLALCFWHVGNYDAASQLFGELLTADPNRVEALRGLAALAMERADYAQALEFQAQLIERGERNAELFYNTGLLLQKAGQVDDAVKLYQEALAERPVFPEALLNLGHALKSQGNQSEAANCWKQALAQKPELAGNQLSR